ncbi:MAG: DUF4145 domain-containing protein [Salinivirgaceae bacterium]
MKDLIKSYCQRCDYETNHKVISNKTFRSDYNDYDYQIDYMIVECMGCETISFRKELIDIESAYPDENGNWQPDITVSTFPNELKIKKRLGNLYDLPEKIKRIYNEAIDAFNSNCFILTGVAFRAVIEAICLEEKIKGNSLEVKINKLIAQNLITEKEANRLHSIRFIGNDSVHEMTVPNEKSLRLVLNIIENLLSSLYLIDSDSDGLIEKVIVHFQEFERLLNKSIKKYASGDELPLAKILNKDLRRLNGKIADYERELIDKINNNSFTNLGIGKVETYGNDSKKRQHFIIK